MSRKIYVGLLVGCAVLAYGMYEHMFLARLDLELALSLHHRTTREGVVIAQWISLAGSVITRTVIGLLVTIWLFSQRERELVVGWIAAIGGGGLLNIFLKYIFNRPRPPISIMSISVLGGSFPSGHAMGAVIAYGMLAYLVRTHSGSRILNITVIFFTLLVIAAIGFSRMYLGVHYLSDVIAGYLVGVAWLIICIAAVKKVRF